jgi:hypothetical protein
VNNSQYPADPEALNAVKAWWPFMTWAIKKRREYPNSAVFRHMPKIAGSLVQWEYWLRNRYTLSLVAIKEAIKRNL